MRVLHGCFEIPGWGGAATVAYTLFARMQGDGADAHYVNLVRADDLPLLVAAFGPDGGNPAGHRDVHTLVLPEPLWRPHASLAALIDSLRPDLLVARGFIAAWLMKRAAPGVPLAFLTSGSWQVKHRLHAGLIDDFLDFRRQVARGVPFAPARGDREWWAVAHSDLVVLHSPIVREAFAVFYPAHLGRVYANLISVADEVYESAAPFAALAQPFAARDIDVVFVASNWQRPEKNYPLLRRLVTARPDLRMHVIGALDDPTLPAVQHGIVADRAGLHALLGRAKVLVCPSRWDPAPGVLFEASAMGCNVVASPNCGNWELCHPALRAAGPESFAGCLARALAAPLPDNRAHFRGGYADLVDTLTALI